MSRTSSILFWLSITLAVSLGLYHTSYRVDALSHNLRSVNAHIMEEQRNIHILKAEWVFLSTPSRIENAARKHLELEPTKTKQFSSLRKLSSRLPTKREAAAYARKQAKRLAQRMAQRARPVALTPRMASSEQGRINHRIMIGKTTAHIAPRPTKYKFAGDSSYGIGGTR